MSEQPKHTPGPWSVCAPLLAGYGASAIVCHELENGENVEIATIQEPLVAIKASVRWLGLSIANANLIAAAPDMLAALERMVASHLDRKIDRDGYCEETTCCCCGEVWVGREPIASMGEGHSPDCIALAAEKAIAKAKGGAK